MYRRGRALPVALMEGPAERGQAHNRAESAWAAGSPDTAAGR